MIGTDFAQAMLEAARSRLGRDSCYLVAADGQALPFGDGTFDAVVCVLGIADKAPMWGVLADALSRELPMQRETLHLSFALADVERPEHLFHTTGFGDVVSSERRARGPWCLSTPTGRMLKQMSGCCLKLIARFPNRAGAWCARK